MKRKGYLAEIIQDGAYFNVTTKEVVDGHSKEISRLSLEGFNSLIEAEHYLKNTPLEEGESFQNIIIYDSNNWNGRRHRKLNQELIALGRATISPQNLISFL